MARFAGIFQVVVPLLALACLAPAHAAVEPAELAPLREKAEKGNGLAQYNLGLAYAQGDGVPADLPEAFVWLSLASNNGATGKALDQVLGNITDAQLAEGRRRLDEYRVEISAKRATSIPTATKRVFSHGFSLTAPDSSQPSVAHVSSPIPEPSPTPPVKAATPEPAREVPPLPTVVAGTNDMIRLTAELARANDTIREQAATIQKLQVELLRRQGSAPSAKLTPGR